MNGTPKRIHNPIPPEYANIFVLRTITIIVGIFCLLLTGYATWVVYTMSNNIAVYQDSLEVEAAVRRVAPIDFSMLERVVTIEEKKQTFKLPPITTDVFYNRTVTSTGSTAPEQALIGTSSTLHSSSSTRL